MSRNEHFQAGAGPRFLGMPTGQPYLRFGHIPADERSVNHAEGWKEEGVSVYDLHPHTNKPMDPDPQWNSPGAEWAKDGMDNRVRDWHRGREIGQVVTGKFVGVGHDGEPLIQQVKHLRDWEGPSRR